MLICVKNYIDCRELWADEDFEMIAIQVKGKYPKFTLEIVGFYRAPNDDMRVNKRLAAKTGYTGNSTKHSITGGELNLPYVDWNGNAGGNSGTQAFINSLVWENGFTQVIDSPTRGDALLDVYLVRPESSFTASSTVQGISDHHGVILEVQGEENCCVPQVEKFVPVYHKTDVLGLRTLLGGKFGIWACDGSSVEEIWNNFKEIVSESIQRFVPHKILRKNPRP
jgi:hypothetical protein